MLIEIIVSGENGRKTKKNNSSENVKKNEHILCEKKKQISIVWNWQP